MRLQYLNSTCSRHIIHMSLQCLTLSEKDLYALKYHIAHHSGDAAVSISLS